MPTPAGARAGAEAGRAGSVPSCTTGLEDALRRLEVPGLSTAIVREGRVACTAVAGLADIERNLPVEPETLFSWASVSKTVTATAVMQLVESGAIALEDDVNAHLPFRVRNPACPDQPITILHLLTHTSSIVESGDGAYGRLYVTGDSPIALGDFLEAYLVPSGAFYSRENFEPNCPGTASSYSNVGAGLLGYLVEVTAGVPFETFTQDRIFTPLGMTEAAWRLSDLDIARVATPYSGDPWSGFDPLGHIGFPTFPDGLLRTSAPQLARFLLMFMGLGELDGTRILSRNSVEEMRRVRFPHLDERLGLIWSYGNVGSRRGLIGHDGSDPGASSLMYFDPASDTGVLLVTNGNWDWDSAETLVDRLFAEAESY